MYTVQVTMLPLEAGTTDLTGGGGTGLSILSSLLGSSGPISKFTRFVASIYTTGLSEYLDKKYDMVCWVYHCDPKTRAYSKSVGFYADLNRTFARIAHMPDPDAPRGPVDLANFIYNNVVISPDRNTKMLVIQMDNKDPEFAKKFLQQLVNGDNDYIKEQDNKIVRKEMEYISQQLRTNTDLTQRDVLVKMLADQQQHLMLTNVDLPYVALIQDGPTVQGANNAIRFFATFVMFGFMLGGALGIALTFIPSRRRPWSSSWQKS
jgi:hypothetical protein